MLLSTMMTADLQSYWRPTWSWVPWRQEGRQLIIVLLQAGYPAMLQVIFCLRWAACSSKRLLTEAHKNRFCAFRSPGRSCTMSSVPDTQLNAAGVSAHMACHR